MRQSKTSGKISFVFRLILGTIFLIAGLAKIADPVRFLLTLRAFELLPQTADRFFAVYLPWLEFVLGLFLILGILHRTSSLLLAGVNLIFTSAILSVMIRGKVIDCGCFGLLADVLKLPDSADIKAVIRDVLFIGMCLYIFRTEKTAISLEGYIRKKSA
jgi:putative oxidoreductase